MNQSSPAFPARNARKANPERRCIATGESMDRAQMVRFVAGPDGDVVPDIAGTLPGRGMWVSARRGAVDTAVAKNLFSRAGRTRLTVRPDLADLVERVLRDRALGILGLARKAGRVVTGMEKVAAQAVHERHPAVGFLQASDGARNGAERIARLAAGRPVLRQFSSSELTLALGGENVVHAALSDRGLCERLLAEAGRINGFMRASSPAGEDKKVA